MRRKKKTLVILYEVKGESWDYKREYFRGITLEASPRKVWKALENGCWDVIGEDIRHLRAVRKRKGGER